MTDVTGRPLESVDDILEVAQLAHIQYYEVVGRRWDGFDAATEAEEGEKLHDEDVVRMQLMQRTQNDYLAVRSRAEVHPEEGVLVADVAAFFQADGPLDISPQLADRFAHRVAHPIIRPYLREALQSTAVRLGMEPPLLPPLDHNGDEVITPA